MQHLLQDNMSLVCAGFDCAGGCLTRMRCNRSTHRVSSKITSDPTMRGYCWPGGSQGDFLCARVRCASRETSGARYQLSALQQTLPPPASICDWFMATFFLRSGSTISWSVVSTLAPAKDAQGRRVRCGTSLPSSASPIPTSPHPDPTSRTRISAQEWKA